MNVSRYDVLFMEREASPFSGGGVEERLLRSAKFGVYDFDDAMQWDTGFTHDRNRRLSLKSSKVLAAVRAADRVIAGNSVLADWASSHNRDVVIIPTCVEPSDYEYKGNYELADPPRIGWIGTPTNERYLVRITEALLKTHWKTGARLVILSGSHSKDLGELNVMVDRVGWSLATQRSIVRTFDIGIMPLPDSQYERGKCGYKLLQYAAAGVPAVGSPVGVNREILSSCGMPGPSTVGEWYEVLSHMLRATPSSRQILAESARRIVDKHYTYRVWTESWCAAVLSGR